MSDFVTPWTVPRQALSMGFSRYEYWSRLPFPSPGNLPDSREHQNAPRKGVFCSSRFYKHSFPLKTHETEVPHNKALPFTVMAQSKPRAASQDNEYSQGRQTPELCHLWLWCLPEPGRQGEKVNQRDKIQIMERTCYLEWKTDTTKVNSSK